MSEPTQQPANPAQQPEGAPPQLGAGAVKIMTPTQVREALAKGQLRDYLATDNRTL